MTILLDMDGVLADLVGGVLELYGLDPKLASQVAGWDGLASVVSLHSRYQVTNASLWATVGHAGSDFWASLKPYPWALKLLQLCTSRGATLVCSTPASPQSAAGKLDWLGKWAPDASVCLVSGPGSFEHPPQPTSVKRHLSHPGAFLIDDHRSSCEAFQLAGGRAFVWPTPWNGGVTDHTLESHRRAGWQALEELRCIL